MADGFVGPRGPGPGTDLELVAWAAPEPILEEACGVVAVNRVADEAVRSPFLGGMVKLTGILSRGEMLHELRSSRLSAGGKCRRVLSPILSIG